MADLFVSYSKNSKSLVGQFVNRLAGLGISIWWDQDMVSGEVIATAVNERIANARVVLVVWCNSSVRSQWVYSEADRARRQEKLIAVIAPGITDADLPPPFDTIHCVDIRDTDAVLRALEKFGIVPAAVSHGVIKEPKALQLAECAPPCVRRKNRLRFSFWRVMKTKGNLRVSFAVLIRIRAGGKFLVVRNLHRPELFGPFGGVYKYFEASKEILDQLLFVAEGVPFEDDAINDVRGFVPKRNVHSFIEWFESGANRETVALCAHREFLEELKEVGYQNVRDTVTDIHLRYVRRVEEGPVAVTERGYDQFRIFDVVDMVEERHPCEFLQRLIETTSAQNDLELVTAEEIKAGRSKRGNLLGQQCALLFAEKAFRPDTPLYN